MKKFQEMIKKEGDACNNEYDEAFNKIRNAIWIHIDKTGFETFKFILIKYDKWIGKEDQPQRAQSVIVFSVHSVVINRSRK